MRRATIRSRRLKNPLKARTVGHFPHDSPPSRTGRPTQSEESGKRSNRRESSSSWYGKAGENEFSSIRNRFAPLRILHRYVNPFPEWRETGAWEFVYYKFVHSLLETPHRIAWDGGLAADLATKEGTDQVEALLPVQQLDRQQLWGTDADRPCADAHSMTYTWIGQSSCLIQMNGVNILTDPVFGLQPIESVFSPTRMRPMPCKIEELTGSNGKIDYVLISHNHFDHLQTDVIPYFSSSTHWIVPEGVGPLVIKHGVDRTRVTELSWWEKTDLPLEVEARNYQGEMQTVSRHITITAAPSMHWTGRSLFDVNKSLWCSYVIRVGPQQSIVDGTLEQSFFFCCDSGYTPLTFSSIGRALGPVDAAAIPIGSYKPRWFMGIQHGNPEDALRIATDIGSPRNFATHWGTWSMSDERWNEPHHDLQTALKREELPNKFFSTVPFGQTIVIKDEQEHSIAVS